MRRRELGLTQADLAGPEYTKSFISQLESGHADPSLDTLRFLGRRLELSLSMMAGDAADQDLSLLGGLLAWASGPVRDRRPALAREAVVLACEIAKEAGTGLHHAEAALLLVDLDLAQGDLERARAALAELPRQPSLSPRVATRMDLATGRLALRSGDAAAATAAFRQALGSLRRTSRHPDLAASALLGLAGAAIALGELGQARRRLKTAIALARRHHLDAWYGRGLLGLAHLFGLEGQPAQAVPPMREAIEALRDHHDTLVLLDAHLALGRAALAAGDADLTLRIAGDAHAVANRLGSTLGRARSEILTGRALLAQGRDDQAFPLLAASVEMIGDAYASERAEAARDLAALHRARGDQDGSTRYLAQAEDAERAAPRASWLIDLLG